MKLLIILLLSIIIIIYIYYYKSNSLIPFSYIENFIIDDKNKIKTYLEELQDIVSNGELDNTIIDNNLTINGSSFINNIDNDIKIDGNLIIKNKSFSNIIHLDKLIINNKYIFYTKDDALIIGRIDKEKNIYPNMILNPGSKEGLWIIHKLNNKDVSYYWYNNGKSGKDSKEINNKGNMSSFNDILKNSDIRPLKYIDKL